MAATLADGQLATSATALYTRAGSDGIVSVSLHNTSGSTTETVLLTFIRSGSVSRQLARAVLVPNGHANIDGIAMGSGDQLLGQTTDASTVDYIVAAGTGSLTGVAQDSTGAVQGAGSSVIVATSVTTAKLNTGPAPTDTYAATMTIDVTKSFHVIAGVNGTSATSTLTPSAAGTAGDLLTIVTSADSSGTVTMTFAATFHSSGTQATTGSHFSTIEFVSDGTRWVERCRTTALS